MAKEESHDKDLDGLGEGKAEGVPGPFKGLQDPRVQAILDAYIKSVASSASDQTEPVVNAGEDVIPPLLQVMEQI